MLNAIRKLFTKKSEAPAPSFNYEEVKPQPVVLEPVVEVAPAPVVKAKPAKKAPAVKKPRAPKAK